MIGISSCWKPEIETQREAKKWEVMVAEHTLTVRTGPNIS
jgi:hypothetical protein